LAGTLLQYIVDKCSEYNSYDLDLLNYTGDLTKQKQIEDRDNSWRSWVGSPSIPLRRESLRQFSGIRRMLSGGSKFLAASTGSSL
jgi:hypothetical protein